MSLLYSIALLAGSAQQPIGQPPAAVAKEKASASELEAMDDRVEQAATAIEAGDFAKAIVLLDAVIERFETAYPENPTTKYYSTDVVTQAVVYAALAGREKKNSDVLGPSWSTAYFLKGFALIDLKRPDEALPYFNKALTLSPLDSQFMAERAEWYKSRRDWDRAYADFKAAADNSDYEKDSLKADRKGRGLRGMAFVLAEQGKWKEAERVIRQAIKLNPNDKKARGELKYIEDNR